VRTIKVSEEAYRLIKRFAEERGLRSLREALDRILEEYSSGYRSSGVGYQKKHPVDSAVKCRARRVTQRAYVLECSDGRKAFTPLETLLRIVEEFGDSVEIVESSAAGSGDQTPKLL